MRPVDQTIIHDPEHGQYGDCFRACIASLMEMPIEKVPHFLAGPNPVSWLAVTNLWLARWELAFVEIGSIDMIPVMSIAPCYHTITGPSPRDRSIDHTVIGLDGDVYFDPHPSRAGLAPGTEDRRYLYGFIVKRCT